MPLNVEDTAGLLGLLNDKFAVINAAPFHLTLRIAEAAAADPQPLSRSDRGRGEHAARQGACRQTQAPPSFRSAGYAPGFVSVAAFEG